MIDNSRQEKKSWILRYQNLVSSLISILAFLVSLCFTEIIKAQKPYLEFNIPKLIINVGISIILWFAIKIVLNYINGVIGNIQYLRTQLAQDVKSGVKKLNKITKKVINEIKQDVTGSFNDVKQITRESMSEIKQNTASSFYKGFFMLLSPELKAGLQNLENRIGKAVNLDFAGRAVVFNFLIESISKMGESGFAMVDAMVGDYVKYISRTLEDSELNASATCVVRPYWFVVDEIIDGVTGEPITLAPYYREHNRYGKGEHLPYFATKKKRTKYQRILAVDEIMVSEILLTASIDKELYSKDKSQCPLCNTGCPIHNSRIRITALDDAPEVYWFKRDVNRELGVDLFYTRVGYDGKQSLPELEDRVYASKPGLQLNVQFEFINLQRGILRIDWGNSRVITIPDIALVDKVTQNRIKFGNGKEHNVYKSILALLASSKIEDEQFKSRMKNYLEILKSHVQVYFSKQKISNLTVTVGNPENMKNLLAFGSETFRDIIITTIEKLQSELKDKRIDTIYKDFVHYYKNNGIPSVAYVITYDKGHPEYPVRAAQWEDNWKGILNNAKTT